jgi:S1-C subfamily serine protease
MQNRSFFPQPPEPPLESRPPPSRTMPLRARIQIVYRRFQFILFILAGFAIAFSSIYLYNLTQPTPQRLTQKDINNAVNKALAAATPPPSFQSQVYQKILPSVVSVQGSTAKNDGKIDSSQGTGVVIDESGSILTCWHVVKSVDRIRVIFADGTESAASVAVSDPENDLALLAPATIPDDLIPATLVSSSTLHVGDEVVALGHPFGVPYSLTSGVVSGLNRHFKSKQTGALLSNLIQFDAAVNPGNSGGPLVNRNGEVVGIVEALLNPNEQEVFIGIGFAVPLDSAGGAMGSPWW